VTVEPTGTLGYLIVLKTKPGGQGGKDTYLVHKNVGVALDFWREHRRLQCRDGSAH
jgi:hypothetical protein